jgi:RND family efflux transporter MFP subunit
MALTWARNGLWALAVLLLGGGLAYGLLVGKPGPDAEAVPEAAPLSVDVVVAAPETRSLSVETQGTVRPLREIDLVSQVAGKVVEVSPRFARGGFFAANELLVKIEDVDYRLQIARAESQVAAARQTLAEEEGRALQAQREWRDLGSDKANALFLRKPQIAAARAALKASEADLEAARLDLARTQISAPFNGRISEKHVDLGQYVSPGSAIATVYDTNIVQVLLPLTDRQVALLDLPLSYYDTDTPQERVGVPVELRARFASREWQWQGTIVRTDANIDESSRVVYAVAEVERPFSREGDSERPPLSPGLFVNATISGRELPDVVELPRSAMRPEGIVMVVDEDNRARPRQVRVLDSDAERVWVRGLEFGERVIATQAALVLAGMEVAPAEPENLTAGGA